MPCKDSQAKSIRKKSQRHWQRYSGNSATGAKTLIILTPEEIAEDDAEIEELIGIVFLRGDF